MPPAMRRFLLVLTLILSACDPAPKAPVLLDPPTVELPARVKLLKPDEAEQFLAANPLAQVIDARSAAEWKEQGHLNGAQNFDALNETALERLAQLDPGKPCLVYCAIGERARIVASKMVALGFTDLQILDGGMNAWVRAGKPVVK